MKKKAIIIFFMLLFATSYTQEIKSYTWDEVPKFNAIPEQFKNAPAVVLKDSRWIHIRSHQYAFASFIMRHEAIKIIDKKVINDFNKVRAVNGLTREVKDFRARIIKPNGKIEVLSENKITETEVNKVKSIAFEGVEEGDIIEYYYILKEVPVGSDIEIFQKEIPILDAKIKFTGNNVGYQIQASDLLKYDDQKDADVYTGKNIPAFVSEKNACNVALMQKVVFEATENFQFIRWKNFLKENFGLILIDLGIKSPWDKKLTEFIKAQNLEDETIPADKRLILLDNFFKDNFEIVYGEEKTWKRNSLDGRIKIKPNFIYMLYQKSLKGMNIKYKLNVAVDRFVGNADPDYKLSALPHSYVIYIPETNKYMSPLEQDVPYGQVSYSIQKTTPIIYSFDKFSWPKLIEDNKIQIPVTPFSFNTETTDINVSLTTDFSNVKINKSQNITGYKSHYQRDMLREIGFGDSKLEKEKLIKDITLSGIEAKVISQSVTNEKFEHNYTNQPLSYKVEAETTQDFIENAGTYLLVNLGKTIGKQTNLYQEITRIKPVELRFANTYKHKINFTIPTGYKVESFKDFIFEKTVERKGQSTCSFKSFAKIDNNILTIEVEEIYGDITYSVEEYPLYREVVNAAADFEKAVLILKPI